MPTINVSVPHKLPPGEAVKRIRELLSRATAEYSGQISNLQENWNATVGSYSASVRGFSVSGTLTVEASVVLVELTIPFAAMLFKGQIESGIRDQLTKVLS